MKSRKYHKRKCKTKRKYKTKESAKKALDKIMNGDNPPPVLHYYKCMFCEKYHLTSKTKESQKKIKYQLEMRSLEQKLIREENLVRDLGFED